MYSDLVMIDVGASNGCMSKKWPGTVYAFEPNPKNLEQLRRLASKRYHVIEKAVDEVNGERIFYEASYTNSSSLLPFTEDIKKWKCPPSMRVPLSMIDHYKVDCTRLDTYLDSINFQGDIEYVKVDTQGNDLRVIKSLGKYLDSVKKIQAEVQITEFEMYKGSTKKEELIEFMVKHGFEITNVQKWSHDQEENITFTRAFNAYDAKTVQSGGEAFQHLEVCEGCKTCKEWDLSFFQRNKIINEKNKKSESDL